ncbi:MAG: hypothetical protein U9O56_00310 [Campylobacterota bacterium]|nr:hypothetical protein [Campylobacterota bacterium]
MTKLSVIVFILKQRVPNILLLSVMFSSLIVIFMVGIGTKNVFYDYLRSDYGNIPDIKVKLTNIDDKDMTKLVEQLKSKYSNDNIDILSGYEYIQNVSIIDSEDLLLTNGLELFVKSLNFSKEADLLIDNQKHRLAIQNIIYQDEQSISIKLNGLKIKDINSVKLLSKNTPIEYGFCKNITIVDDILKIEAINCKDKIDILQEKIEKDKAQDIKVEVDGKVFSTKIIYNDIYYKSIVLAAKDITSIKNISIKYQNLECDNRYVDSTEISNGEIIINFKEDKTKIKNFKRFLSHILKDFINYNRMVLKLKLHSFADDDADDKQDPELVYLNELTDLIDLIFSQENGNLAVSSSFLAQDLNNFGLLENFTIINENYEYPINIRSTVEYNPEKFYDKNIIMINKEYMQEVLNIENKNNFIDIYSAAFSSSSKLKELSNIVSKYDKNFTILTQEDIIPSIKPKKFLFDTTVLVLAIFILMILFVAMYIVLRQFYSNFNSELSLLKLYGSKIPYQAYINFTSFLISAVLNYIFMIKEQEIINQIMLKYFFIEFSISLSDFVISLSILFVYVVLLYILEYKEIKKLNLIKGQ